MAKYFELFICYIKKRIFMAKYFELFICYIKKKKFCKHYISKYFYNNNFRLLRKIMAKYFKIFTNRKFFKILRYKIFWYYYGCGCGAEVFACDRDVSLWKWSILKYFFKVLCYKMLIIKYYSINYIFWRICFAIKFSDT